MKYNAYVIDFFINKEKSLKEMQMLVDENETIDDIILIEDHDFDILIKTFPCLTAKCECGFNLMNNICINLSSKLIITNIANLMFI